ncbi:MAG: class I SAM-dependent methyltransferase [Chitinispirillales bacterium]|jgi:2-polyprenyl-3-methyl-5-hydroxy-6-metoxy-1,4-benzoquinol methylase|nr:class I SAM-dependent methyltransferase [Chitinispirillales bacterium]
MKLPFDPVEFTLETPHPASPLKLTRPADPESVLETITDLEYEKDKFLPYWAEVWPSSQSLYKYLLTLKLDVNTRALEMGCGIGSISALLASKGIVCAASDISPQACMYALFNIKNNGGKGAALCCDWRFSPIKNQSFDLITASDVLYEKRWIEPVLTFIQKMLSPNGQAFIADPCRSSWEEFKINAQRRGLCLDIVKRETVNNGKTDVEILRITSQASV